MRNALGSLTCKIGHSVRWTASGQSCQVAQKCDSGSDGPHLRKIAQTAPNCDTRSKGPSRSKSGGTKSSHIIHLKESSIEFCESDDGCDMVTGAKLIPRMVTELLNGRPMRSQIPTQRPILPADHEHFDATLPVPEIPTTATPADTINRLA